MRTVTRTTPIGRKTERLSGPKKFGFWPYDQFPYVLGATGRVIEGDSHRAGMFEADGYGGAAFAKPTVFADVEQGREIKRQLDELEAEYNATMKTIKEAFHIRARRIAPFIKP